VKPYILFIIIIGGILVLFIYVTRLASNEIFSQSNKIHQEAGRAKDLSAPLYKQHYLIQESNMMNEFALSVKLVIELKYKAVAADNTYRFDMLRV
jgi:hypothetical protein